MNKDLQILAICRESEKYIIVKLFYWKGYKTNYKLDVEGAFQLQ